MREPVHIARRGFASKIRDGRSDRSGRAPNGRGIWCERATPSRQRSAAPARVTSAAAPQTVLANENVIAAYLGEGLT